MTEYKVALEKIEIAHVLLGDSGDGDIVDIDLLPPNQVQQEIERPVVDLERNLVLGQRWVSFPTIKPHASRTSGIQSSGRLHLGNYLGAMRQHIELQQEHECFYFIANFHSLTTVQNADLVRAYTRDVALDYLATGLDPDKACLFRQSDIPEVTELLVCCA